MSDPKPKFKPGDVVYLKSGGPAMTVGMVYEAGFNVDCTWFINGDAISHGFHEDQLTTKDPGPGSQFPLPVL